MKLTDVPINIDWSIDGLVEAMMARENWLRLRHTRRLFWTAAGQPKIDGKMIASQRSGAEGFNAIYECEEGWACIVSWGKGHQQSLTLACETEEQLKKFVAKMLPRMPKSEPKTGSVPISFWGLGRNTNAQVSRDLKVPTWAEVHNNYPTSTREQIEELLQGFEPQSGRLVLWHGPAGMGKTWALRALLWEWRSWCRGHYIVDPERLFGDDSAYLLHVLLSETKDEDDEEDEAMDELAFLVGKEGEATRPKSSSIWKLLILEDTGELLSQDAKERAGQGLSRLLNVTDGLIGQGLNLLVLITTNEPLTKLHSAVARPGRTAAEIEFRPFNGEEAEEWLDNHGKQTEFGSLGTHTLAELYAHLHGRKRMRKQHDTLVGFRN